MDASSEPAHETDDGRICYCPASGVIETLGRRYAIPILSVIGAHGTIRFGEIEGHLPEASTSTLSSRLDELQAAGLVEREQYDEIPPRVEYELSDDGEDLAALLAAIVEWAVERDAGCEVAFDG